MIRLFLLLTLANGVRGDKESVLLGDYCPKNLCPNTAIKTNPAMKYFYSRINSANVKQTLDFNLIEPWVIANNVSMYVQSGNVETLRTTFLKTFQSTLGPDVANWQAYQLLQDSLAKLNDFAIATGLLGQMSKQYLDAGTNENGDILAVPTSVSWWGLWYHKPTFLAAGITSTPTTFAELFIALDKLQQYTGVPAWCISHGDFWQAMAVWQLLVQRIGGASAYKKFLAKQMNLETDPVNLEAMKIIGQLLPYMQQGPTTFTKTFVNTMGDWALQKCSIYLFSGTARLYPSFVGKNNDDYSWFRFPDQFGPLPYSETSETANYNMVMVNSNTRFMNKSIEFLGYVTSVDYQRASVPYLNGNLPANTELQSLITDPEIYRGVIMMNQTANTINSADAMLPDWAVVAKPVYVQIFTYQISIADAPRIMENVRQQAMLSMTVAPLYSLSGFWLTLTSYTVNATIYYSVNDDSSVYTTYVGPIKMPIGENSITIYATSPNRVNSAVNKYPVTVADTITKGEILLNSPDSISYLLSFCIGAVGSWVCLIIIEQAIYSNSKKSLLGTMNERRQAAIVTNLWLLAATFAIEICIWASISAGISGITIKALPSTLSPITFEEGPIFGSLFVTFPLLYAALYFMTVERKKVVGSGNGGGENSMMTTTKSDQRTSNIVYDVYKPDLADTEEKIQSEKMKMKMTKARKYYLYISHRLDRYLFTSSLLIVASILANYFVAMIGIILPCDITYGKIGIIFAIIVSFIFSMVGVFMIFYLKENEARPLGAFVMNGAIVSAQFIITSDITFSYTGIDHGEYMSSSTLLSISAAATALASFILVGINVRKLKLSRDTTDSALTKLNREMVELKKKLLESEKRLIYDQWQILSLRTVYTSEKRKSHFLHPSSHKNRLDDSLITVINIGEILPVSKHDNQVNTSPFKKLSDEKMSNSTLLPTVNEIMDNVITCEFFHRFSMGTLTDECFKFLADVELFKLLHDVNDIKDAYDNIVHVYITEDSLMQINIDHKTRINVIRSAKSIKSTVFDECVQEIKGSIIKNDWPRFSKDVDSMNSCVNILNKDKKVMDVLKLETRTVMKADSKTLVANSNLEKAVNILEPKKE